MKKPIPFGKYYLLERINIGGMAEVFRAKAFGVEGFERLVAVKRILPNIAEDKDFIRMFVDEAKIAVQLNHANIAQVFDLGVEDGSYYIALEHIHGRDVRAIFDRCRNHGEPMPVAQACFVTMKVCEGLDYAHNKRDASGHELNLVHRDVSPQNIIVSFEGEVKLIDFGIAKAAGKGSKTQAGILKGKFGYMSPEQVRGLPIDRRSDVFSCGIVLYELLTGERLFVGESDFSTLEKVRNVEILPPSTYNRRIQPELERIILKALSKDVEDRYHNAIDLHDELQAFVYTAGEFYSRKDLAAWMKGSFALEIEEEAAKLEAYRHMAPPPQASSELMPTESHRKPTASLSGGKTLPPPLPTAAVRRTTAPQSAAAVAAAKADGLDWDDDELETTIYDEDDNDGAIMPAPSRPQAPSPALMTQEAVAATGAASGPTEPDLSSLVSTAKGWDAPDTLQEEQLKTAESPGRVADGSNKTASPLPEPHTISDPATATDGDPSAVVRLANLAATHTAGEPIHTSGFGTTFTEEPKTKNRKLVAVVAAAAGLVLVVGTVLAILHFTGDDDAAGSESKVAAGAVTGSNPTGEDSATPASPVLDPETGFDLIVDPAGVQVILDGQRIGKAPLQIRNLPEGAHEVEIEAPAGFFNKREKVDVVRGTAKRVVIELDAMAIAGRFSSDPPGAQVTLVSDGTRTEVGESPAQADLDPRKRYEVMFAKDGYVTVTRPVEVNGTEPVSVDVTMEAVRVASVDSDKSVRIRTVSDEPRRTTVGSGSARTSDKPPKRDPTPDPVKTTPETKADDPPVKEEPESPRVAGGGGVGTLMLSSKPPCQVFVDGRNTGETTPVRGLELKAGKHEITLINNDLGVKKKFSVKIEADKPTRVVKNLMSQVSN